MFKNYEKGESIVGRLTDNDKKFGPITVGRSSWKPIRVVFSTGGDDDDEAPCNTLTAYAFGWVVRLNLPTIMQPHRVKNIAQYWDAATIERMGRDWYYEVFPRDFGFCFNEGHLSLYYGPQTHSSSTTKQRGWFLPWRQWRHVRHSFYDTSGVLFWEQTQKKDIRGADKFKKQWDAENECPSVSFLVCDYDGSEAVAKTRIEEREWRYGEGYFKWLSWFRKPMLRRSLKIDFDKETGPEKGSWKGGTCGAGIEMLPGELHESAFRRYCANTHKSKSGKYQVQFVGVAA